MNVSRILWAFLLVVVLSSSAYAQVVSLSRVYVDQSGYGKIQGDAYIGEWRSTPTSTDKLLVSFDGKSVSSALGETVTVTNPTTVELTSSSYGAAYTFSNPVAVYNVDYVQGKLPGFYILQSSCKTDVQSYFGKNFPVVYGQGTYFLNYGSCEYYAWVGVNLEGYVSNVNFDQTEWTNTWTVKQNGVTQGQITLSAQKNKPTVLSQWYSDKLFIEYVGSVAWVFQNPTAANVKAFYDKKTNSWRLINWQDYDAYSTKVGGLSSSDPYSFKGSTSADWDFDNSLAKLRTSVLPNEWTNSNVVKTQLSGLSQSQGEAHVQLTGSVSIPTFSMVVDADWVGIQTTAGDPEIVSASAVSFSEGNTGLTNVLVKNKGTGKGSFSVEAICSSGFSGSSQQLTLDPGKTQTVSLGVQGKNTGLTTDQKGTCTVKLTETNTGVSVQKSVSVTMKSLQSCTPGEEQAFKDDSTGLWGIKTCDSNGQIFKVSKTCANLEIVQRSTTTGKLECFRPDSTKAPAGGGGFSSWLLVVSLVFGVVVGGFVTASLGGFVRKVKGFAGIGLMVLLFVVVAGVTTVLVAALIKWLFGLVVGFFSFRFLGGIL